MITMDKYSLRLDGIINTAMTAKLEEAINHIKVSSLMNLSM